MRCTLLVLVVIFLTLAKSQFNNGTQEEETGLIVSSGLVKRSASIRTMTKKRQNIKGRKNATHQKSKKQFGSCDYVRLSGLDKCKNGDQALLNSKLLFLKVDQTDIVAFSKSTKMFMKCSTLTDKTAELKCESVKNLDKMLLSDSAGSGSFKCGVQKPGERIVGGTETPDGKYPWMVALANSSGGWWGCGATLIAADWVLSAAHCFHKQNYEGVQVRIGAHLLNNKQTSEGFLIPVETVIVHEDYDPRTVENDMTLLKLSKQVDLMKYAPACLPEREINYEGNTAWVYGWGTTSAGGPVSNVLLEVSLPIITRKECEDAYGKKNIFDGQICAYGAEEGKDSCQGDSGGPMTVDENNQHYLAGVVSWGIGCAKKGNPGVYADVSYYRDWIDTNIEDNGGGKFRP